MANTNSGDAPAMQRLSRSWVERFYTSKVCSTPNPHKKTKGTANLVSCC